VINVDKVTLARASILAGDLTRQSTVNGKTYRVGDYVSTGIMSNAVQLVNRSNPPLRTDVVASS
jgi:hypothetical protein